MVIHGSSGLRGPITQHQDRWVRDRPVVTPTLYDPPIRTDLVERVKAEIAAGEYDTPERFEAALMAMLESERN